MASDGLVSIANQYHVDILSAGRKSLKLVSAYKIFEVHTVDGVVLPKTLFHGHHGSRCLELDRWLEADEHEIRVNKLPYISGFHAFLTFTDAAAWAKRTRSNVPRAGCWVTLRGTERKPGAVQDVVLARGLLIPSHNWQYRTTITRIREHG